MDIVEARIEGGHEGRHLGAEPCGQAVGRRLATAPVTQGCVPARLEAALQSLKLPDAQPQTRGSLPIGDASCEGGLDQAGPEQLLPAHREGLHGAMTLPRREPPMTLSRSSYPMTFSCSSSNAGRARLTTRRRLSTLKRIRRASCREGWPGERRP